MTAALDEQMRIVLRDLALCSHVPAPSYQPKGRSGATKSIILQGDTGAEVYRTAYNAATTDAQRSRILARARDELHLIKRRAAPAATTGETEAQLFARIVAAGEGWLASEVAASLGVGIKLVFRARRQHGRDLQRGETITADRPATTDDIRHRVVELRRRGDSYRAIALKCRVAVGTVHNYLKDAA